MYSQEVNFPSSSVILSGVAASLREAATQSKDPYPLHNRCGRTWRNQRSRAV